MFPKAQCSDLQALDTSIVERRYLEIVMFDMTFAYLGSALGC